MATSDTLSKSSSTVTVACKLPHGLVLRLFRMEDYEVPVPGGGTRTEKRAVQKGESIKVNGVAVPYGKAPTTIISDGYALTTNVPSDFFEEWLRQNAEADYVKNKMIFAKPREEDVKAFAKENAGRRSGLEPIDPEKPPVRGVAKADDKAA